MCQKQIGTLLPGTLCVEEDTTPEVLPEVDSKLSLFRRKSKNFDARDQASVQASQRTTLIQTMDERITFLGEH